MNVNKLPLNKKTTIIAEKFIIAVANRISNDEVIVTYTNLKNHKEVLRILQRIKKGIQILKYADADFWDIYVDGQYIENYDFSFFKDLEAKIKVTTVDKSLEIVSFHRGIFPERNIFSGKLLKQVT